MKLSWFNKRKLWLIIAVVVLASGSAWRLVNRARSGPINLEAVRRGDLTLEIPIIGALNAARSADITAPISNDPHFFKIARMAPEGSQVEAGQMVMELDTQEINQKLREYQAELGGGQSKTRNCAPQTSSRSRDSIGARTQAIPG
jgi:multidrug efflux pump subunit AcrA (membrane-fusion protein)